MNAVFRELVKRRRYLVCFVLLAVPRAHLLESPGTTDQYYNQIEADYLFRTGFDYYSLRYREPHIDAGGYRCYMTGVIPTAIAAMRTLGVRVPSTMAIYRLFVLGCASVLAIRLYDALAAHVGALASFGLCLSLFTTPLFFCQIEMVGMEIPMTTFVLLATIAAAEGRFERAAAWNVLAFAIKNTALLSGFVSAAYVLKDFARRFCRRAPIGEAHPSAISTVVNLAWPLVGFAIMRWGSTVESRLEQPKVVTLSAWPLLNPDVLVLFAAAAVCWIVFAIRHRRLGVACAESSAFDPSYIRFRTIVLSVMQTAVFLAAIASVVFHPRYLVVTMPFLYLIIGLSVSAWRGGAMVLVVASMLNSAFNVMNLEGRFFPTLPQRWQRTATFVERSREYLHDHESLIKAVSIAREWNRRIPVVANESHVRAMAIPGCGFVDSPLRGYTTTGYRLPGFKDVFAIWRDRPSSVLVLSASDAFRPDGLFEFPAPGPEDRVLFHDGLPSPLILYEKWFVSDGQSDPYVAWLMEIMPDPELNGERNAELILARGGRELAAAYASLWLQRRPDSARARRLVSELTGGTQPRDSVADGPVGMENR